MWVLRCVEGFFLLCKVVSLFVVVFIYYTIRTGILIFICKRGGGDRRVTKFFFFFMNLDFGKPHFLRFDEGEGRFLKHRRQSQEGGWSNKNLPCPPPIMSTWFVTYPGGSLEGLLG